MRTYLINLRGRKKTILVMTLSLVVLTAVIFNAFKYYTAFIPAFSQPIRHGSDNLDAVAITCNVDWGDEYLPDMLEIFKAGGIKATFFITGRWAQNNEELTRLIADSGHTVANHGYSHKDHSKLDYQQNKSEIAKTQAIIEGITGKPPRFFAPPSGAYNKETVKASNDLGCEVILWSIDTIDWKRDGVDNIVSRVKSKLHSGGIILMHPTDQTLEALPSIIENIKAKGYEIIPLEDIVNTIDN